MTGDGHGKWTVRGPYRQRWRAQMGANIRSRPGALKSINRVFSALLAFFAVQKNWSIAV